MSTTSQRMGLKIPDGSDPFLRTDFVQNYNTLDSYPGVRICTSTTRPSWGSGQAGMLILETDTRRNMMWTGTTWREMLYGPAVWWGSTRPQVTAGANTILTYTVGTFTVNRPGTILGLLTTEMALSCRGLNGCNVRCMLDGVDANIDTGNGGEFIASALPNSSTFGTGKSVQTVPSMGIRNISAGTHSIGLRVQTSTSNVADLKLTSVRAMAVFVNGTDR